MDCYYKIIKQLTLIFTVFFCCQSISYASEKESFIIHHVKDDYSWHITSYGENSELVIHLPIIVLSKSRGLEIFLSSNFYDKHHNLKNHEGYYINEHGKLANIDSNLYFIDLSITKNVVANMLGMAVMLIIFVSFGIRSRKHNVRHRGLYALLETLVEFVRDGIVVPNIGKKYAYIYMPYILTMFFFIWITNVLGLLPGAANVTGNISIALALACFTFLYTNLSGKKEYWSHLVHIPGVPKWLAPIMIPVEIIGLFTKPFALVIRLFANITAGHIILLSIVNLIFILQTKYAAIISVPFGTFMFMLKLLVSFLQAYIFSLLSSIYIGAAVAEHDKKH